MKMNILDHFNQRVINTPNNICLSSPELSFTFEQLDQYSDYISEQIDSKSKKKIIPLFIKNDIYILPTILAIFKLGRIPLPLTTSLEFEQSTFRIADIEYDLIVSDQQILQDYDGSNSFKILSLPEPFINNSYKKGGSTKQSDIAYIICTSGSTGVPKKVFLSNKNISWLMEEFFSVVEFDNNSSFLFTTPYTFDVSLTELLSPIFTGGKLICFSEKLKNTEKLKLTTSYIEKYNITHLSISPTYANLLVDISSADKFKGLKYMCLAGEKFEARLAYKLAPVIKNGTRILNLYGPSETTIYSTYYQVTGQESYEVPIGKALRGCRLKVLNENGQEYKSGELYIGGIGVSLGYLLDKKLNDEKFVEIDSHRYYSTGDFVHYNENRELVFETRKDNQIQINGIRVELGEIESMVVRCEEVKECKAVYDGKRIYIFYQLEVNTKKIREELKKIIPQYLNPILIEVPEFLVNQNRKFDSKKMIEKYYFEKELNTSGSINKKLKQILKKLDIISYEDMDSLDTVRFFLGVEEEFKITIDDKMISSFLNLSQLIYFIENEELYSDIKTPALNYDKPEIYDEINLEMMLNRCYREEDLEEKIIPTLFMQKQYWIKKYESILSIDLGFDEINMKEMEKLEYNIKKIANKLDILRMILISEEDNLYFKKIKKNKFIPIIYVARSTFKDTTIKKLLYRIENSQQFFTVVYPAEKKITIYFSHNIMDKSSLFKAKKIFNNLINSKKTQLSEKSYEEYIEFIKESNANISVTDMLSLIPQKDQRLPILREHVENRVLLLETKLDGKEATSITVEAIFKFSQYIFSICNELTSLSGSFVANIRNFNDFDARELIGDIHSNIPFEIKSDQSFCEFEKDVNKLVKLHEEGVNIRDKIFDDYPYFSGMYGEAKKRLENLTVSFNYIGEVRDADSFIQEIIEARFQRKYIVIFSSKNRLYQVIINDSLLPNELLIDFNGVSEKIIIEDYLYNIYN